MSTIRKAAATIANRKVGSEVVGGGLGGGPIGPVAQTW